MTNLILTGAKTFGKTLLKTAGNIAVSYANQAISNAFYDNVREGPRLETVHIQSSSDGSPMPRVYGKVRLAGQVIWAARVKEHITETSAGGKGGGPTSREYSYTVSFAIGLCEGEILSVDRIWANGVPLRTADLNMRVHRGAQNQSADPLIAEIENETVPAYRGTAYVVFEDFALDDFGARLPQLNFEVTRVPPRVSGEPKLEDLVKGVNLIPGSGEFTYSPSIIERRIGRGATQPENMNNLSGKSDLEASLDQLEAQLPNCKSVNLIVCWFGDDLRAGHCKLRPGVESADKQIVNGAWSVGGAMRGSAYLINQVDGRPVYGGTPSDASVIEAIQTLKARGFNVCLHPFILMDIKTGNGLPDPYGGVEQAAYPWRGRITCHPASSQAASADQTSAADSQVQSFFGHCTLAHFSQSGGSVSYSGPSEHSYRRMVLHMAYLAKAAGGVDRFLIGSELRGLTNVRGAGATPQTRFPAVGALKALASDVKSVLGAAALISYAADWSEYFGYHPADGSGDVYFHLDPLWSDPNIDAVGVDAYFPLSDWRGGGGHLDAQSHDTIYDLEYLKSNVEGGEGYDWFYANAADRDAQVRTPISDGLANKPWVYRYKDLRKWWQNPHYERINDAEQSTPTAWVAKSKPFWFCELGCPAIDKGANQPNVFYDPKSSESFFPYYSEGNRNDLIQRRYIEAMALYWGDPNHNPVSDTYAGRMIDMDNTHIWCWDARPYPDFPSRLTVWSDGDNWTRGHWLNGRIGLVALADIIFDIAARAGLPGVDVSRVYGMVAGAMIERPMSARAALASITAIYGVDMIEGPNGVRFVSSTDTAQTQIDPDHIAAQGETPALTYSRRDDSERPLDVRIRFIDQEHDYQSGSVYARDQRAETVNIDDFAAPVVLDRSNAKVLAEKRLKDFLASGESLKFNIGPAHAHLECGDVVTLSGDPTAWQVTELSGQGTRSLSARRLSPSPEMVGGNTPPIPAPAPWASDPELIILDMPQTETRRGGVLVGALMTPFRPCRVSVGDETAALTRPARVGVLTSALKRGRAGVIDYHSFDIQMMGADLFALEDAAFFAGGNRFAVRTDSGTEILQARDVTLIGPNQYRLTALLRGQFGSDDAMVDDVPAGAEIIKLDSGMAPLAIHSENRGETVSLSVLANGRHEAQIHDFIFEANDLKPLSPVHIRAVHNGDSIDISWIRRTRQGGDNWNGLDVPLGEAFERYHVQVLDGDDVVWSKDTDMPSVSIPVTAFGPNSPILTIRIAQYSQAYGMGSVGALEFLFE